VVVTGKLPPLQVLNAWRIDMENRRSFIKLVGLTGMTTFATIKGASALSECDFRQTPSQAKGPFYPLDFPADKDSSLLVKKDICQITKRQPAGPLLCFEWEPLKFGRVIYRDVLTSSFAALR
jgi:hypothetical protein